MFSQPLKLFLDAEFTQFIGPKLISFGIVAEDRREFYAELSDTYIEGDCSTFVLDTVLPLLEGGDVLMTERECAAKLKAWIEEIGQPVMLVSDAPTFDFPLIRDILEPAGWPANLAKHCWSFIVDDCDSLDIEPIDETMRHHALHDARAYRALYFWLHGPGNASLPQESTTEGKLTTT